MGSLYDDLRKRKEQQEKEREQAERVRAQVECDEKIKVHLIAYLDDVLNQVKTHCAELKRQFPGEPESTCEVVATENHGFELTAMKKAVFAYEQIFADVQLQGTAIVVRFCRRGLPTKKPSLFWSQQKVDEWNRRHGVQCYDRWEFDGKRVLGSGVYKSHVASGHECTPTCEYLAENLIQWAVGLSCPLFTRKHSLPPGSSP